MNEYNEKRLLLTARSISKVINSPLVPNNSKYLNSNDTLLHYICDNSLGYVIEFISNVADSNEIFNIQDDDGNTPLHLLCSRVDELEVREDEDLNQSHVENFTSVPSPLKVISMINYLSNYADLSIKNKFRFEPGDLTDNVTVHNAYYRQMVQKRNNKFPSPKLINDNIPNKPDWNVLFKLRDPDQKNRTLLHHLCIGDRLNAIKFLVGLGANVNVKSKRNKGGVTYDATPMDALFKDQQISFVVNDHTTSSDIKVPSGFRRSLEANIPNYGYALESVLLDDYEIVLMNNEKRILKEAESIAEYLVKNGADFTINSYCDLSDIMYDLYKWKSNNNNNNKRKKPLLSGLIGYNGVSGFNGLSGIGSLVENFSNGIMKYSCFPIGNFVNNYFDSRKKYSKVKFVRVSSLINQNQDNEEKPLLNN